MNEKIVMDYPQEVFGEKIKRLEGIIREKLERIMSPVVAGRFGDEYFSFDAASYYTLVSDSKGKIYPVKLGWGETSASTYLLPKDELLYPEINGSIREIPVPVYCLSQSDSYLASELKQEEMNDDISSYMKENAIYVYEKDGLGFVGNERVDDKSIGRHLNIESLPILDIDDAINRMESFNV